MEPFAEASGDIAYSLGAYGLKGFERFKSLRFYEDNTNNIG
jgi:hypothetical protein